MVLLSSILNFLRQEREYRTTLSLLHAMDDHRLADIGVRRDQIDSFTAELRKIKREQAAAKVDKQGRGQTRRPAHRGHGLAAQH